MRFRDRRSAGLELVAELRPLLDPGDTTAMVLALPRGGVEVAASVAQALQLPLEVLVVRKLGLPEQPELAMGAIARGRVMLNRDVIDAAGVTDQVIRQVIAQEQRELLRREALYRKGAAPLELAQRTVILIDDGIATGSTALSAIRGVREEVPRRLILATPVASTQALDLLQSEVDELVCLAAPEPFYSVGASYDSFDQVSDREVTALIAACNHNTTVGHAT
ncbi:MAG: phosphoribosyltransferase family protein [Gemmatimonadota bacterium]